MLASDSDEIERSAVRGICLAAPESWPTRTATHAAVAEDLQLHPANTVHGLPMEDAAVMAKEIERIVKLPDVQWRAMSDIAHQTATRYTWDDATTLFEAALQQK